MPSNSLNLIIKTREDTMYTGEVKAVSSVNEKGPFDILPEHAYFITLINRMITIRNLDGSEKKIPIDTGIMHVEENKVHIYLENYIPT